MYFNIITHDTNNVYNAVKEICITIFVAMYNACYTLMKPYVVKAERLAAPAA